MAGTKIVNIKTILSEICVSRSGIAEDLSSGDVALFRWVISDISKDRGTSVFRVKQSRLSNPRKLVTSEDGGNTVLRNFGNH